MRELFRLGQPMNDEAHGSMGREANRILAAVTFPNHYNGIDK